VASSIAVARELDRALMRREGTGLELQCRCREFELHVCSRHLDELDGRARHELDSHADKLDDGRRGRVGDIHGRARCELAAGPNAMAAVIREHLHGAVLTVAELDA
jgi:hypothetical protein